MKVLVVDDNPLVRRILAGVVRREGHEPVEAADGAAGLERFAQGGIDTVVTDLSMPGMDGAALIAGIRALKDTPYAYLIVQSAHDERAQVLAAMAAGADDFVSKADLPLELPLRLRVAQRILSIQAQLRDHAFDLERHNQRMAADIAAAVRVQAASLPQQPPQHPLLDCAFRWRPCDALGGDAFGLHQAPDGTLGCYLIDVSGHGVASSLLAVQVSRVLAPDEGGILFDGNRVRDPLAVLAELNRRFPMEHNAMLYFTALVAVIDPAAGEVRFASAGHPGPILSCDGSARHLAISGHPIGMLPPEVFQAGAHRERIRPGDRLLLITDGAFEECNAERQDFTIERLVTTYGAAHRRSLDDAHDTLLAAIAAWRGSERGQGDDITLVSVGVR